MKTFPKKKHYKARKNTAFSIAEAMVTLTILAVVAASAAPLVSKQIKNNAFSDIQYKILNDKLINVNQDVNELKNIWAKSTTDNGSITRINGNVGVGMPTNSTFSGKFQINNPNTNLFGFLLTVTEDHNTNIFSIRKGTTPKLWMAKDGSLNIGVTKNGKNVDTATISTSADGIMSFLPPHNTTYETEYGGSPAIKVYYPNDSNKKYDNYTNIKGITYYPIDDGITNTFLLTSWGSTYINSIAPSGIALAIRNGAEHRFTVYNTGKQEILLDKDAKWGLIIKDSDMKNLFVVNEDGRVYIKGKIENSDLDNKFAKVNDELDESKKMIAQLNSTVIEATNLISELKEQNEKMAAKIAELETKDAMPLLKEANKVVQEEKKSKQIINPKLVQK